LNKPVNASDRLQVEDQKKRVKERRKQELNDIITVLSTISGRRFIWRILGKCRTFESVWEASAKIHYNAGKQDLGHYIMAEISESDSNLLFKMMKENNKGDKSE